MSLWAGAGGLLGPVGGYVGRGGKLGPGCMSCIACLLERRSACTHSCGLSHTQQMHTNPLNVFRWEIQFLEFPGAQPALADAPTTMDKNTQGLL